MKKPFKRDAADAVAQSLGFDRSRVAWVLTSMECALRRNPGWDDWVKTTQEWRSGLATCDCFSDDKAFCEDVALSFVRGALLDVVLRLEDNSEFQGLKHELMHHVSRILKPWMFDDNVEEI